MLNQQIQTERNLISQPNIPSHQEITAADIKPIQKQSPNCCTKFFSFHHILNFFTHFCIGVKKEKLIKYNADFQPMLINTSLWEKFLEVGRQISFAKQIFKMDLLGYIIMLIISFISSLAYLAIFYLQIPFITAVRSNLPNLAWTYAITVFVLLIVKFTSFSYAQNLVHNLGVNAKIHLQNTFIKSILQSTMRSQTRSKYTKLYFQDINHVKQFILTIPYFIVAVAQIIGSMTFIFINIGLYGIVPLGLLLILILINSVFFGMMKRQYNNSLQKTEQRQNIFQFQYENCLQMNYDGKQEVFYKQLQDIRSKEVNAYTIYNLLYTITIFLTDSYTMTTYLILYTISRDNLDLSNQQIFVAFAFLASNNAAMRYINYAGTNILQARKSLKQLSKSLSPTQFFKSQNQSQFKKGLMVQNVGQCYRGQIKFQPKKSEDKRASIKNTLPQGVKYQRTTLITGRLYSQKFIEKYISDFKKQFSREKTIYSIDSQPFILSASLKENITLFGQYNKRSFQNALQTVELDKLQLPEDMQLNIQSLKAMPWLTFRIELARAIYHRVDVLIINRGLTLEQQVLTRQILESRKFQPNYTTLLNVRNWHLLEQIDNVVYFDIDGKISPHNSIADIKEDKKHQLYWLIEKSELKKMPSKFDKKSRVQNIQELLSSKVKVLSRPQDSPFVAFFKAHFTLFTFFVIVLISELFPLLVRYYIHKFVPDSILSGTVFMRQLVSNLLYIALAFIRSIVLTIYFHFFNKNYSMKIFSTIYAFTVQKVLKVFNRRQRINQQIYVNEALNQTSLRDFDAGVFIIFSIFIYWGTSVGRTVLAMAFVGPALLLSIIIWLLYLKALNQFTLTKQSEMNSFNTYVNDIVSFAPKIMELRKSSQFFEKYTRQNKWNVILQINQFWAFSGVRILNEIIIFTTVVALFVVVITVTGSDPTNRIFTTEGVQVIILFSNLNLFISKLLRPFQMQVINLSQIQRIIKDVPSDQFRTLEQQPQQKKKKQQKQQKSQTVKSQAKQAKNDMNQIQNVEKVKAKEKVQQQKAKKIFSAKQRQILNGNKVTRITFKNVSLNILNYKSCSKLNLQLKAGDRLGINSENYVYVEAIFEALKHIYDKNQISGSININGESYDKFWLSQFSIIKSFPVFPDSFTVLDAMKTYTRKDQTITAEQVQDKLKNLSTILKKKYLAFTPTTPIRQLSDFSKDLLEFVGKTMIKKCAILLLVDPFLNIDRITLTFLLDYLINDPFINIVVHITNNHKTLERYKNTKTFYQGSFVKYHESL